MLRHSGGWVCYSTAIWLQDYFLAPQLCSRVMKEILLSVAAPGTEMFGSKAMQALQFYAATREVKLSQGFRYPDIHWKSGLVSVGKQQDAIRNLASNACQI